jgi:hypothetical protein
MKPAVRATIIGVAGELPYRKDLFKRRATRSSPEQAFLLAEVALVVRRWFIRWVSKRPTADLEADGEVRLGRGRVPHTPVDTNFRPPATAVPELSVIAGIYLDSLRNGRRPIEALMERFNVDRDSAKGWPELCRVAGLLPARDQPQIVAAPNDTSQRYRFAG